MDYAQLFSFTGKCSRYSAVGCDKWQSGCNHCPILKTNPKSLLFDNSSFMRKQKDRLFNSLENLTMVGCSQWISNEARKSFLKGFPIKTIHNGINTYIFTPKSSDFRRKYGLENKIIILVISYGWLMWKGHDTMIKLSERLDSKYKVVLVGKASFNDTPLPDNILSIPTIRDKSALAKVYSAADVFIQPSVDENFPTVNLEVLACGTPVITFDTGGCPETVDESCGVVVKKGNNASTMEEKRDILSVLGLTLSDAEIEYLCLSPVEQIERSHFLQINIALEGKEGTERELLKNRIIDDHVTLNTTKEL